MYRRTLKNSFVIRYFEEFYREIIHLKAKIYADNESIATEKKENEPLISSSEHLAQTIIQKLYSILESQALEAAREGGEFAANYYLQAQYIMAALADDIFLNMQWEGRKYWESHMLEMRLYNTHTAGETFFERLTAFLKERDSVRVDLAVVYFLALGLGFRGKFRAHELVLPIIPSKTKGKTVKAAAIQGSNNLEEDQQIRPFMEGLYTFIHNSSPRLFSEESWIFSMAYDHIVTDSKVHFLEDWRRWMWIFIGMMIFMMGLAQLAWYGATHEVQESLDRLLVQTPLLVEEE